MSKLLSIRDVIGPIMVGPSSSHTAGALRIAAMARRLLTGAPAQVTFTLYGSFAHTYRGHGTDRALVAGMLGLAPDDLRIRDSFDLAERAGLAFEFVCAPDEDKPEHPNTVDVRAVDESGEATEVRGVSVGGGAAVITRINGIAVELTGEYHSIVVRQLDAQGVLAHIATCMNMFNVNIATTRMYRERKGKLAYTVMETDDEIPEAIVRPLENNPNILGVRIVKSDRTSGLVAPKDMPLASPDDVGFGADLTPEGAAQLFERLDYASAAQLLAVCEEDDLRISEAICRRERCLLAVSGIAVDDTRRYLFHALDVMRDAAHGPIRNPQPSMGGLIGGESQRLFDLEQRGIASPLLARAITYAMATLETNASMGRIVAAPTAGAAGVVPALLLAAQDVYGFSNDQLEKALANAAAVGYLIMRNANVSGAEGGCQAEVGSASAMAASAAVELFGGTPRQCLAAASNALAGLMGLVCDPVAGLVEAPCQKRNATGVANAIAAAQIALAGVDNLVDFDQTVEAMRRVGAALPHELRETALGGLAATPAACSYCTGCVR